MIVYRIEHKNTGLGPWMQSVKDGIFYQDAFGYIEEPDEMDPSVDVYGKFFGVADTDFFIRTIRNVFAFEGVFDLTSYEVEEGHYHKYIDGQVLFDKKHAVKLNAIPVLDFLRGEEI